MLKYSFNLIDLLKMICFHMAVIGHNTDVPQKAEGLQILELFPT